jgi:hypothetical protein
MIELRFAGWFQCRLATDPDPSDEHRGVSGSTFAFAGEPDLDRIVRFTAPRAPRVPGPSVGVTVHEVVGARGRALLGAPVELLDDPRFEGRNGLLGMVGRELIHPLHVRIARGATLVQRSDRLDAQGHPPALVDRAALARRGGQGGDYDTAVKAELSAATGIADFAGAYEERAAALAAAAERAGDPVREAELRGRLAFLEPLKLERVRYHVRLGEFGDVGTVSSDLEEMVDVQAPWPFECSLGPWDPDALCGYCTGSLTLPAPP